MPPYAGLDEAYHAARLAFEAVEGRSPASAEPSVPPYLKRTLDADPTAAPDFASVGERWPALVRSGRDLLADPPLQPTDRRPYSIANYEAQQPSIYYRLAAPLAGLAPPTALGELRAWRLGSVVLATIAVLAAGALAFRFFGEAGVLAAALVVSAPTWLTLVARAANDAFACAAIAVALAVSLGRGERPRPGNGAGWIAAEAAAWSIAAAGKLYSWPLLGLLPLLFWRQRATRARIAAVTLAVAAAVALVVADFVRRTGNPLGLFAFDPLPAATAAAAPAVAIDWIGAAKIWAATAVWTSGQHWNALRGGAMVACALPLVALALFGLRELWRRQRGLAQLLLAALALFAAAQAVNLAGYLRSARLEGASLPAGGKEAWYWYAMAPLLALPLAAAFKSRRFRGALPLVAALWIAAWDVRIAEGGLFRDWAGETAPGRPSAIFRWGELPDDAELPPTAVGPLAGAQLELRLVHLAGLAALAALAWRAARAARSGDPAPG
jgi:hypothetical protein